MKFVTEVTKQEIQQWDKVVPIIKTNDQERYDVYIFDELQSPGYYSELYHLLFNAIEGTVINIHINSPGGILDTANSLYDVIANSNAITTAYLSGVVASGATLISLACDKLEVADGTEWLSHNYSAGIQGKGAELAVRQEFINKSFKKRFTDIHKGFFSKSEIKRLLEDKDIWLDKQGILKRWDSKLKYKD